MTMTMTSKGSLQTRLFSEMASTALFEQAAACAIEYMEGVRERAVTPDRGRDRGTCRSSTRSFRTPRARPPRSSGSLSANGSPATVATTGGRYFGFVNGAAIPAAVAAKWLSDAWDQNAGLYVMSPIAAQLEAVSERWLVDLFGLPEGTVMGLVGGTSVATLCRDCRRQKRAA